VLAAEKVFDERGSLGLSPIEVGSRSWRGALRRRMGGNDVPVMITQNTSIDYDIHGEGPPLVLIGGLGFGRWEWFKQIPALSRHFRTITFDARGER
jgi:pimeloyl-ACP methyl ester carboxylesterase